MKKLYINISDFQGGSWAVGETLTLKGWRELAMDWADSDENFELYNALKYYKIKNSELIDYINEIWTIEIVPFNKENKEHIELKKEREK